MAENFAANDLITSVTEKLNAGLDEVNDTRRGWRSGYKGVVCRFIGRDWRLDSGGLSTDQPGTNASWIDETPRDSASIRWVAGNTLTRVEDTVGGKVFVFTKRATGNAGIAPSSANGAQNWYIENVGNTLFITPTLGPFLETGQLVYNQSRLYQLLKPYSVLPTPGTNANYKDILADAMTGDTSGGVVTTPPPATADGTNTTYAYNEYDLSQAWRRLQGTGFSAQEFVVSSVLSDFTGLGYIVTQGTATSQDQAAGAYFNNIVNSTADLKAWIRVRSVNIGDSGGGRSAGTGSYSTVSTTQAGWHWLRLPTNHKAYDREWRFYSLANNFAFDKLILTPTTNNDIPSGKNGFNKV